MKLYDCKKIHRITVMYSAEGPGTFAGDKIKILGEEESRAICEEANQREISIEKFLKSKEKIESVVLNLVVPFPDHVLKSKPDRETGEQFTQKAESVAAK